MQLEEYDLKVINKAKEYADKRNLDTLGATVDMFDETEDKNYKYELYNLLKVMIKDIEERDKRIAKWRASQKIFKLQKN